MVMTALQRATKFSWDAGYIKLLLPLLHYSAIPEEGTPIFLLIPLVWRPFLAAALKWQIAKSQSDPWAPTCPKSAREQTWNRQSSN